MKIFVILLMLWRFILWAWTTPKTWTAEPLTSSDLNTYMRDNQNDIRARQDNNDDYILDEGSDYTTTSTSFVDVDATNLALTITTNGGDVLVGFNGAARNSAVNYIMHFNIDVDGSPVAGDDGITALGASNTTNVKPIGLTYLVEGLSAGSHTFKLQWKVSNGTGTIFAGAGTSNHDIHSQFWVQEL